MQQVNSLFVTGACGFIGSHLLAELVCQGFEAAILKLPQEDPWRIKHLLPRIKVYEADLKDTLKIIEAVSDFRPQAIIHLAAQYKINHRSEEVPLLFQANSLGTASILEAAKETGVKHFINTSTFFVYDSSKQSFKEEGRLKPFNLYALTKICSEKICSFYSQEYGINCLTFRLFPPYGPADNKRRLIPYLISSFIKGEQPKLTQGLQEWDFIYVRDIVEAYIKAVTNFNSSPGHEIFNIGTARPVRIKEIVEKIQDILGTNIEPLYGAVADRKNELMYVCADNKKARKILSWEPKIDILKDGLELTVNWYRENEQ
ncbi:MAG: NAD-dependent epimerase/dehydratase family protein [Candidatus Omnitrophica bacterium]|nr:NAD-dependent epimerase/dehydratase family protein [Candidatus Omnitrophota bacterium]